MPKLAITPSDFSRGISSSKKTGKTPNTISFNRATDFRNETSEVTLNPKSQLDTGSLIEDLPMWMERACSRTFAYDKSGNIYLKESGVWSKTQTAPESQGNGLAYFAEDSNLYYTQNKTIGRLLEACTGSDYFNSFLETEGGEATNTKSISFNGTTQYASRADTASLSITGDITLETYIKPSSLPTTGNTMTLISKWDENTNLRSYKLDIITVSNFFGDGSDGALTISTNTTEDPIDSSCSGTEGTKTLTATNTSFAAGQKILIHQTRGTNAGTIQYTEIESYTAGTITTTDNLDISFNSTGDNKAQVRVMPQYTDVTINSGITYTAKAWNGTVGGILAFYANGTLTVTGTITGKGKGFRGGLGGYLNPASIPHSGASGESPTGPSVAGQSATTDAGGTVSPVSPANGAGGGGGRGSRGQDGASGGAGGSHADKAEAGDPKNGVTPTYAGGASGSAIGDSLLTNIQLGPAGGGGGKGKDNTGSNGGNGGGIALLFAKDIVVTGSINFDGDDASTSGDQGGGGGGAGGSISFKCQTLDVGTELVTSQGGAGRARLDPERGGGGDGSNGIIHAYYLTSTTGTTTPTFISTEDTSLGSADGYAIRLQVSDDGTDVDTYTQEVTDSISTSEWARWAVSWDSSASTAKFYRNGSLIGTKIGTMTSIHDNASVFTIGADFDSTAQNFYAGLMDDTRVWNDVRTVSELVNNNDVALVGTEANLIAYYEFEDNVTDSQTSGLNDLTATGTPTYSTDVPFIGLTSRTDQDLAGANNLAVAGDYALTTSVTETDANRVFFVPTKDPQKSITLKVDTIGTGDWTVTVHDPKNRVVATSTVENSQLSTGFYEFDFSSEWRPIIGATYHFHVTSTVADGIINVKTGETTLSNGTEQYAYYTTHYQILVNDEYHPIMQYQNMLVIGNERYVATIEGGDIYNPHRLTLPSGYRIRAIGFWREFVVFGLWRGTNITDYDQGKLVIWDGVSDTYNQIIDVPEGGINSMFGSGDTLFFFAGYTGKLMAYAGGLTAQKVQKIPFIEKDKYVEFAPGAMTMWRTYLTFGTNLLTDSTDIHQGVYTFGQENVQSPYSLSFDYPLSLGDQTSTNVKVGVVFPSGQDLYIGWKNSNSSGIDKISVTNDPYPTGTIELQINDFNNIGGETEPLTAKAIFKPLASGESVVLKYRPDRETDWEVLDTQSTEGANESRATINERVREAEIAVDLRTTTTTSPTLLGVSLELDTMDDERNI